MDEYDFYEKHVIHELIKAYDALSDTLAFTYRYGNADRLADLVEYQKLNLHIYCNIASSLGILKSYKK